MTADTISAHMVSLEIRRASDQASPDDAVFQRKLPLTMRTSKLKVLVNRLYRGNIKKLILSYVSPERPDWEIELDRERDLRFFGVEDGNWLVVRYVYLHGGWRVPEVGGPGLGLEPLVTVRLLTDHWWEVGPLLAV